MSELENRLQKDLVAAMKEKNERAVSAIRSVKTAIQNEKTNGSFHELTDTDVTKLIQKLAKQRTESIEIYTQAGRNELADNEKEELKTLEQYLPKMLTEEELQAVILGIIEDVDAKTMKDMGMVMKELSNKYPNQYDGKIASTFIKTRLS